MREKEEPFYSEEEFRERLEKLKERVKSDFKRWYTIFVDKYSSYHRWDWIYPELDKELLTYEQKKIVAREIFPFVEEIVKKAEEEKEKRLRENEKILREWENIKNSMTLEDLIKWREKK
jgi:cobalamin biosynthesis Co2+ chelatase CbiK